MGGSGGVGHQSTKFNKGKFHPEVHAFIHKFLQKCFYQEPMDSSVKWNCSRYTISLSASISLEETKKYTSMYICLGASARVIYI